MSALGGKADIRVPPDALIPSGAAGPPFGSGERPIGRDQHLATARLAAGVLESRLDVVQTVGRLGVHMELSSAIRPTRSP